MRRALLIGSEWLPNRAGGLNRYFHGLVHAVGRAGLPASGLVTFLRPGQHGPIPLTAMADEGAGPWERLNGVRHQARIALDRGVALANPHFALYAWPWVRDLPRGVPLIVSFHGPWADEMLAERSDLAARLKAALARTMERHVYRRADACITLSAAFAEVLAQRYSVQLDRIRVVAGGADLSPFLNAPGRAEARRRMGWPEERRIVLAIRRLTRRVGLELLIDAASQVRRECPNVLILIGGSGPLTGELEARIEAAGLGDTVRLLGFVPEDLLPPAYAAADVSVLPSVALEGFGLALVESMAAGTPAVGAPVGGIPEVLHPFEPRLIAEAVDAAAIASALSGVLSGRIAAPDPDACRAYAQRFGWETVFPQIRDVWRRAGADVG